MARKEPDIYTPSIGLVAKLGSIIVHVEEGVSANGHDFDWMAIRSLLSDREIKAWMSACRRRGLLPVKR